MGDWRAWLIGSATAVRIGRDICVIAAVGLTIAAALALATLAVDRPFGWADHLLIPSFPVLFAGQVWGVAILTARRPVRERRWRRPSRHAFGGSVERDPRRFFFEGLPVLQANVLLAVALLGWLAAIATFPSLTSGGPTSPSPGCPYRLNNHGSYKCVSRATYIHVGAAEQRFAASIIAAFFAIQFGMSAAELARRRMAASA